MAVPLPLCGLNCRDSAEQFRQPLADAVKVLRPFCFALPNHERTPAQFAQRPLMNLVTRGVAFKFPHPEDTVVRGCCAISATSMAMPEAPVNENHGLVFCEHNVRSARKFPPMQTKAITQFVQERPDDLLRRRILATNSRHVPRAAFFRQPVFVHLVSLTSLAKNVEFFSCSARYRVTMSTPARIARLLRASGSAVSAMWAADSWTTTVSQGAQSS